MTLKITKFVTAFLLATSISVSAFAGEIGRMDVNGKEVILMDDKTWKYSGVLADVNTACSVIKAKSFPISFCLSGDTWTKANVNEQAEIQFKLFDDSLFGIVIANKAVKPNKAFRTKILANAKSIAAGGAVNIVEESSSVVGGNKLNKIRYQLMLGELDVTYFNYYAGIKDKGSVQIIFFMETASVNEKMPHIKQVLAKAKIQ